MRIIIVHRKDSEHRAAVEAFLRDYRQQTGNEIEEIDPDSPEGINFCSVRDIVEYPTIVALAPDGSVYQEWRGAMLPTISEVAGVAAI